MLKRKTRKSKRTVHELALIGFKNEKKQEKKRRRFGEEQKELQLLEENCLGNMYYMHPCDSQAISHRDRFGVSKHRETLQSGWFPSLSNSFLSGR